MRKAISLFVSAALLVFGAVMLNPARTSAGDCHYEGTTWDVCNGQSCPGGWCCKICLL